MASLHILSVIIFTPLVGVLFILLSYSFKGDDEAITNSARWVALWASLATFTVSLFVWIQFDSTQADFQFVEKVEWIKSFGISYHVGLDGISLFFVLLSTFLTPICILSSWEAIKSHVREYMIAFLVLETFMVGMFCALDMFLFYIFFEGVLIPMFVIIGIWGGPRRVYAAFKFFLYTLLGSVLMLLAMMAMYLIAKTTSIPELIDHEFARSVQIWLWLAFFASFAVKIPM